MIRRNVIYRPAPQFCPMRVLLALMCTCCGSWRIGCPDGKATVTLDRTISWSSTGCDLANVRPIGNVCYDLQILRSVFVAGDRSSYDWSYAWSCDQQRLEKIDGKIHRIVGNSTTSGSHNRSIVRSIVAPDDRSYDQSYNSATDSVGRRMGSDLNPRNISTFYSVGEQSIGGTTGRKVARSVAH